MRISLAAALSFAVSGCALFEKAGFEAAAQRTTSASAISQNPTSAVRSDANFKPAFGAGAPAALVPCRAQASLDSGCRRSSVSHERRGDMPAGENSETFSDATTVSLSPE
ncbi:MAG: hypothetical protein ACKVS5_16765 [Parvularculaceae bacterium]